MMPMPYDPDQPIEWTGNPLAIAGTRCTVGDVEAELMRFDGVEVLNLPSDRSTPVARFRRAWILHISDATDTRIGDRTLSSVVLVNLMPEAAKREAETIIRWAATSRA